jgi:hypothetical protein
VGEVEERRRAARLEVDGDERLAVVGARPSARCRRGAPAGAPRDRRRSGGTPRPSRSAR